MDILCIGETLFDIFGREKRIGGAPLNVALMGKLLGLNTGIITAVGKDKLGKEITDFVRNRKINHIIQKRNVETGAVKVSMKGKKHTFNIKDKVAYDYIRATKKSLRFVKDSDVIYYGSLAQRRNRKEIQKLIDNSPGLKIYDMNLRGGENELTIFESLKRADILKISDEELERIRDIFDVEPIRYLKNFSLRKIIITKGEKGAELLEKQGDSWKRTKVRGLKRKIADTVGCGDAFTAGFLYALLNKRDDKLSLANKVAGAVAEIRGAIPSEIDISKARVRAYE
ncbi:MAG: PfkB family carbohydrate kinase [Nanobdellota archaeon]